MTIKHIHVIQHAAKMGIALTPSIVREANMKVDREALEEKHRARFTHVPWDGKSEVNGISAEVWLDSVPGCRQSIEKGNIAYHIYKDGKLFCFQPHHPHHSGIVGIQTDLDHEHHVDKVAEAHIADFVANEANQEHLDLALEHALDLHEEKGIPYGITHVASIQ